MENEMKKEAEVENEPFYLCFSLRSDCFYEGTTCPKAKRILKEFNAEEIERLKKCIY